MDLTQILFFLQALRSRLTQISENLKVFSRMVFAANFCHFIWVPASFAANMGFPKGLYF